jgi:hypothetical protein
LSLLAARLARAMAKGALAPMDPLEAAAIVWSGCHGVMSLELKSAGPHELDWDVVFRRTNEALLIGLVQGTTR